MPRLSVTAPLRAVMTDTLRRRLDRALHEFPELGNRTVTVGLTKMRGVDGIAVPGEMLIRLRVRRSPVSYFTIGHELTHLLQTPGLGLVPCGEVQCDIWTLARSALFLDDCPTYLDVGCASRDWSRHAHAVRALCRQAIEVRRRDRRYIVWLRRRLRAHYEGPPQRSLLDGLS